MEQDPLIAADGAMARGDKRAAAAMLERAAEKRTNAAILLRLSAVRRSLGDITGALNAVTAAAVAAPGDYVVLMLLGSLRDAVGAHHAGDRAHRSACRSAPADDRVPVQVRQQLALSRRRASAEAEWAAKVQSWQPQGELEGLTPEELRRIDGFRSNILHDLEKPAVPMPEFRIPHLSEQGYFEQPADGPVQEIARRTDVVLAEFLNLAQARASELASRLTGLDSPQPNSEVAGKWSTIPLVRNGEVVEEYAGLCPHTMALFARLDAPQLSLIGPSLYFSVLEPHSRIPPHTGLTNARLIVHWPLIAPGACALRVGEETREWELGRPLLFDDTYEHEAWNDSNRIRVVLISDIWHPGLSALERRAVSELMRRKLIV